MALWQDGVGTRRIAGAVTDHGGSLARARSLFPQAPEPWIDLSTGINPHSYPLLKVPAIVLTRLPEPSRARLLVEIATQAYGVPSPEHVAAAPGTQILLPMVAALVKPGRARILSPTYAEHHRAATIAGHDVEDVVHFDDLAGVDLAVVVNPNNPDGRLIRRDKLLDLAAVLRGRGGLLVVDEAFMDVAPRGYSLAWDVALGGIVVLKSFGKFFGLAGIRLGFALSAPAAIRRLDAELGPWAVSGPALEYGIAALADEAWREAMRRQLSAEAMKLDELLARFGLMVEGGMPLYRFLRTQACTDVFETCGRHGILLRNFTSRSNELRIGLPADSMAWERLEQALSEWREGK